MAGDEVAEFLLSGLLKASETVIKVAAPEIEKAINAAGEALAENGLDLAKVLDLSGAFIPSSPLAFAEALKLAKSLLAAVPELDADTSVLKTIGMFPHLVWRGHAHTRLNAEADITNLHY